jgi:protein gp37
VSDQTSIEWTATRNADGTVTPGATWNPVRGCTRVSAGCENCYAERVAARFSGEGQPYEGLARMTSKGPLWTGKIKLVEEHLNDPIKWKRPRRIFVNSMSDLFHEGVPDSFIDRIFAVMALAPQHTFQVLTKRPERMSRYVWNAQARVASLAGYATNEGDWYKWPLKNVWLGVSCEDQKTADERIPLLLQTPAAVRWVSAEPLLGPIDFWDWLHPFKNGDATYGWERQCSQIAPDNLRHCGYSPEEHPFLNWVVVGGESGPGARPMHPSWVRVIRDQCAEGNTPFFFKQFGEWWPGIGNVTYSPSAPLHEWLDGYWARRIGKKRAGRLLDGKEYSEFPEVSQ